MTLIDAIYIHDLGGKLLLQYFIDELDKKHLKGFYFLLDERIKLKNIPHNFQFLKASERNRKIFYFKNERKFSKIFVFQMSPHLTKPKLKHISIFIMI